MKKTSHDNSYCVPSVCFIQCITGNGFVRKCFSNNSKKTHEMIVAFNHSLTGRYYWSPEVWILTRNVCLSKSWMETLEEVMCKKKKALRWSQTARPLLCFWDPDTKNLMLSALKKLMQLLLNTSGDYGIMLNAQMYRFSRGRIAKESCGQKLDLILSVLQQYPPQIY